jgi:transglutaminase-like putative cysteine protease
MMVIKPETLEGPFEDDSVRGGGLSCRIEAWKPDTWYPFAPTDFKLTLTEFPDPEGKSSYFLVPNPEEDDFVEDELILN